ncbi:MAG: zinc ribbon domain-containing protein [Myxococcales bacterium]|nr:zinc ribbon domain-containing protein [Myxococcales bacterium]
MIRRGGGVDHPVDGLTPCLRGFTRALMPTYSYRCNSCGHQFEKVQRITEEAIKLCPACGVEAAARQIQSGNFILKGGGWYGDLYSGGSNKKASTSGTESGSGAVACDTGACAAPAACAAPSADTGSKAN